MAALILLSQSVPLAPLQQALGREFPAHPLQCFSDLRKALSYIKKCKPDIVIAEFIYAPTYGSQLSNFEALCATLQRQSSPSHLIALVAKADQHHIGRLNDNVHIDQLLDLPLNLNDLVNAIKTQLGQVSD